MRWQASFGGDGELDEYRLGEVRGRIHSRVRKRTEARVGVLHVTGSVFFRYSEFP
jgi:hypothetical protein